MILSTSSPINREEKRMSYFVVMFDQEGIAIVRPPTDQVDAKQLAERYEFLRAIEPAIQRFGDAVRRAGEKYVVPSEERQTALAYREQVWQEFFDAHPELCPNQQPIQANRNLLEAYLNDNRMNVTPETVEIALMRNIDSLAR